MRRLYGAGPLHLLLMGFVFALIGYVVHVAGIATFWNRDVWWQSIAVWFAGAVVLHDLVLVPLYSIVDRALRASSRLLRPSVPVLNHIRIPALGAALTFALFFPGIIEQGSDTYRTATGLTQEPYLVRWLLLTAALFGASAVLYTVRIATSHRARNRRES
ncbi:hypothetical protein CH253_15155 [Rhodococcus sp. 06-156-3C]|uniref:hypothetical protein n=1 Tax=Nocardiaceae TaxID=85025 RepID=UPI000522F890|nr:MULTISPECIES: hypothetical protein [Rhodococcus]OZD17685.1 hypothetical protein CH280_07595 [Rhodococcus sp. 06-156-4C]OZD20281.1 hypothetical protein CH253_15155 [Rhodococcus sp. 06-156-3C]OZD21515.1 hypothetical protein CH248_10425 [Rhodococcus sp. 06-156-4a]OZD33281.1 hypothetical protein CH247_09135 [Rhodococcus sp. 06-156-3b]OZD40056.1 hypothetical protein CH284_03345 [Rhodococcus sp. 06-156-3]